MIDPRVTVMPTPAALAAAVADYFIEVLDAALTLRGAAAVALAGGQTPRAMNARLAGESLRDRLDWTKVSFYFGDERCVPPEHADSNFRMTRETLFEPLEIRPERIYRMQGELEPHAAAEAYEHVLQQTLGPLPVFDLVLLGMGPDGHTASLFPGTLAGIDDGRCAVANFVPKFNAYRLTLTPHVLNAARQIAITAADAEKAASLREVLAGPVEPDRYPAQLIARGGGSVRWFVDSAAASELETSTA